MGFVKTGTDLANIVAFLTGVESFNMADEIITCDSGCSSQYMSEGVNC